jgi:hypothetical protein
VIIEKNKFKIPIKMHIRLFFFLFILLSACSGNDDDTIDIKEIMPVSHYDKAEKKDTNSIVASFIPSVVALDLHTEKIIWDSVRVNEELTVPERFSPKNTEKFTYWIGENPVEYYRWSFSDSLKTMKAFLNWMNCYGEKCLMIELRKNTNIQRNTVLILQNDTSIVQIQSASVGLNELKKWKKLYFTPKGIKWNYILIQPRAGKAIWSKFENEEEVEFVQLENE